MSDRWVALLRGINVGGANVLPMADLRRLLAELGYAQVRTYIQSGNCVFDQAGTTPGRIQRQIQRGVEAKFGFRPQVLVLSLADLNAAIATNPFASESASNPKSVHLFFLAKAVAQTQLSQLDPLKKESEHVALIGQVLYLLAPDGVGRSKLFAKVEHCLGVPATARNFRSVSKIAEL